MIPAERQEEIKRLIIEKKRLKISELSERFQVSEMTIYRDIKPLIELGLVTKISGGIELVDRQVQDITRLTRCVYCHKPNHSRMIYTLILPNNQVENACCPHCGLLRQRQLGQQVSQAICHDLFMNTTISASLAWYVMDTTLNMGCCQPQVLTFENREIAEKFVKGFGGQIYTFSEALELIFEKMQGHPGGCGHHEGANQN